MYIYVYIKYKHTKWIRLRQGSMGVGGEGMRDGNPRSREPWPWGTPAAKKCYYQPILILIYIDIYTCIYICDTYKCIYKYMFCYLPKSLYVYMYIH